MKPITGGCMLSLNKILTKFNELSSSSTVTFPLPFLHLFIHLHSSFFPPTTSMHLPRSVSHSESTSVPPSSSHHLSIQNNSHSRKRAINLLQWDQSARECQGYRGLLSLLTPHSTHVEGEDGQTERQGGPKASKRNNLRYQADTLDRKSRGLSSKEAQQLNLKTLILTGNSIPDPR